MLAIVLFSSLALLSQVEGQAAPVFCNGGKLPCVENAECDAATNECKCKTGFHGNGRIACRDSTRCLCTALADPNYGLFDTKAAVQKMKANLPCSVALLKNALIPGSPSPCIVSGVDAHPEVRGTGTAKNLRVFVKEIEVRTTTPNTQYFVTSTGTNAVTGGASVTSATNSDDFKTATLTACNNFQVGFNATYGGAFVDALDSGSTFNAALCGNCDDTANELMGATNITDLAYFLKHLSTNQKGDYSSECSILSFVTSACSDALLTQAADVCGRYMSDFGLCLVDDATSPVTTFTSLFTTKFTPCVTAVCGGSGLAAQCTALTSSETTTCKAGPNPAACP